MPRSIRNKKRQACSMGRCGPSNFPHYKALDPCNKFKLIVQLDSLVSPCHDLSAREAMKSGHAVGIIFLLAKKWAS
jgi:hypothetical protein